MKMIAIAAIAISNMPAFADGKDKQDTEIRM